MIDSDGRHISKLAEEIKEIQDKVYQIAEEIEMDDFGWDDNSLLGSTRGVRGLANIAALVAAANSLSKPIDAFRVLAKQNG